jgi:hypothetical protein
VAATDRTRLGVLLGGALAALGARGAELPEDSVETMFHTYTGGGVQAHGPAALVRKRLDENVDAWGSYYVDTVSSASIDVVTTASPYHETRIERSGGVDLIARDGLLSLSESSSREPDYLADRTNVDVTQEVFGGMTTIRLGFTRGQDTVKKHGDPTFGASASHWMYRAGLGQVATTRLVFNADFEVDADSGYLGSPYRAARVYGTLVHEVMPTARTSRALALRASFSIDPASAVHARYRYFHDTWGIQGSTLELGYRRDFTPEWRMDATARHYTQKHALFYSDNFTGQLTYMTRNRQLSSFASDLLGGGASWRAWQRPGRAELRLGANLEWMRYHYSDFTDMRTGAAYGFHAVIAEADALLNF